MVLLFFCILVQVQLARFKDWKVKQLWLGKIRFKEKKIEQQINLNYLALKQGKINKETKIRRK